MSKKRNEENLDILEFINWLEQHFDYVHVNHIYFTFSKTLVGNSISMLYFVYLYLMLYNCLSKFTLSVLKIMYFILSSFDTLKKSVWNKDCSTWNCQKVFQRDRNEGYREEEKKQASMKSCCSNCLWVTRRWLLQDRLEDDRRRLILVCLGEGDWDISPAAGNPHWLQVTPAWS